MKLIIALLCVLTSLSVYSYQDNLTATCHYDSPDEGEIKIEVYWMAKEPKNRFKLGAPFLVSISKFDDQTQKWVVSKTYNTIKGQSMVWGTYLTSFVEYKNKTYADFQMHIWGQCPSCAEEIAKFKKPEYASQMAYWTKKKILYVYEKVESAQASLSDDYFPCVINQ